MKRNTAISYLFFIAIITAVSGVIYVSVQQVYRTGADDPQLQIANEINLKLRDGKSVDNFFSDTIDISQSLSPFVSLYDEAGQPLRSSGFLNGKPPVLPEGVFDFTKTHGEHRVTWQPADGVRMAMVLLSSNSSPIRFIAAGRSLTEVEAREHNLITIIFFGWILCVGLVLLHAVLNFYNRNKNL